MVNDGKAPQVFILYDNEDVIASEHLQAGSVRYINTYGAFPTLLIIN
jgi:hypothetical protein